MTDHTEYIKGFVDCDDEALYVKHTLVPYENDGDGKELVFAIDLEGAGSYHDMIASGISVLDSNLLERVSFFLKGYKKDETVFEPRCWEEFWSKHPSVLESITYTGKLALKDRQREMITLIYSLMQTWETYAKTHNYKLCYTVDNIAYDVAEINTLLKLWVPHAKPLPYNTLKQYGPLYETHNIQRGFLMAIDPAYTKDWGYSKRIRELYDLPVPTKEHTHLPHEDAYVIAHEMQMLFGIQQKRYHLRKDIV